MSTSSRKQFIKKLFDINNDASVSDSLSRYQKMGLKCKLARYLNGHATNFVKNQDSKPAFPANGFVALNVEVSASDNKVIPIIPFFSISIDGKIDRKKDRELVLSKSSDAKKRGFLTCPKYMNRTGLEKVLFKVKIQNHDINIDDVCITKYSMFNEVNTPEYDTDMYREEADRLFTSIKNKDIKDTFIYSWCAPFLEKDQELFCNVRAVDRDERYRSHSIFVSIFNTEDEIKEWVAAYGEDIMNIITIVKSIFIDDIHEKQLSESIKSAISAIMSRNMSHNLGSHYLYYTKAHLESLANESGEKGPDIRGAAKVLGYMQARMDYLATIISNDRYPNGSVNFKSQIYDELTVDDFSKRHFQEDVDKSRRTTNFLLSNLIMSENFSRSNIFDNTTKPEGNHMPLILQAMLWDEGTYKVFSGTAVTEQEAQKIAKQSGLSIDSIATIEKEEDIKNKLSRLNLALPGGTMSCHAFFNVLENFIRNSAKYLQEDFQKEGLIITIAIRRNSEDASKYDFLIFDNKKNANKLRPSNDGKQKTLINNINDQLADLRILDKDNGIEKSSKGLKEMLFSSVWMRTYEYPEETYADIINRIHLEKKGQTKLDLIKKYGFTIVPVASNGNIATEDTKDANLGLLFTLPEFQNIATLDITDSDSESVQISKSLGIYADIIEFEKDTSKRNSAGKSYVDFFTRTYFLNSFREAEYQSFVQKAGVVATEEDEISRVAFKYKSILDKRFKEEIDALRAKTPQQEDVDFDSFQLIFGDVWEGEDLVEENRQVYFKRHLSTQETLSNYTGFAYADSVSGGNFTITLDSLVKRGIDEDGNYITWADKLFGLKVKESALTRITLIDERLFNNMLDLGEDRELELELKNIRILNYVSSKVEEAKMLSDIFEGNSFKDGSNRTHFLSIHLGLIEKIVKSNAIVKKFLGRNLSFEDRVKKFMLKLAEGFCCKGGDVFISIHSGRGNFSKELEGPLSTYPFISLAAIENSFSNSKYLLSQLFYNTVYIGKGRINKKK